MLRALALKELRETAWIVAIALVLHFNSVTNIMGWQFLPWHSPPTGRPPGIILASSMGTFLMVTVCLAISLGLRQTIGEASSGTYPFLLHRPVDRRWLFGMKLSTGVGLLLVGSFLPLAAMFWWSLQTGPFDRSMAVGLGNELLSMVVLYLGAFLTGVQPGRWLGTRLLPLVASGFLVFVINLIWIWPLGRLGLIVLASGILVVLILYVAQERDFS